MSRHCDSRIFVFRPLLDKDPEKISMTLENTYGGTWLVMLLAHDVAAGLKPENVIVDWNYLDVIAYAEHMIRGDFWVIIHRVRKSNVTFLANLCSQSVLFYRSSTSSFRRGS